MDTSNSSRACTRFTSLLAALLAAACGSSESGSATPSGTGGTGGAGGGAGSAGAGGGDAAIDVATSADTGTSDDAPSAGFFDDPRDGHRYTEVSIAGAKWMGENLAWESPTGSFCYENNPANCVTGGRLYTFDVAKTACPTGWHLSTDDDWKTLETSLGMPDADLSTDGYSSPRGTNEGTKLKAGGESKLDFPMTGYATVSGNTATGWDGLTSGVVRTYIWTSTVAGALVFRRRIEKADPRVYRFTNPPSGFAIVVRCVSDG